MSDIPPPPGYFFPEEIISSILSRLPVKPLLRFRTVCKRWNTLISPQFVKTRLLRSIYSTPEKVIISTKPLKSSIEHLVGNRILDLDCSFINHEYHIQVLGTSNGFVCLVASKSHSEKDVFLANPSTGNFKKLPPPPDPRRFMVKMNVHSKETYDMFGGFGFDSSIDDFKVVLIPPRMDVASSTPGAIVLYCRENNWRINQAVYSDGFFGESSNFRLTGTKSGALLNGALHWSAGTAFSMGPSKGDSLGSRRVIVYFDLADEVVKKMVLPVELEPYSVGVLGGYLFGYCYGLSSTEIWAMHEYGVSESWVKLYDLPHNVICEKAAIKQVNLLDSLVSVCFLRSGELLLQLNGQWCSIDGENVDRLCRFSRYAKTLAAYNPSNGIVRSVLIDGPLDLRVAALDGERLVPSHGDSKYFPSISTAQ